MKLASALLVVAIGFSLATACKHNDAPIDKDDQPVKKPKKPEKPEKSAKVPKDHRDAHAACSKADTPAPKVLTYGPKMPTPKGPPCTSKADCTAKANGRCNDGTCTYDGCYEDKDCGKTVCECRTDGINGYFCKGGDCAVDADCGAKGYCSPTYGMSCGAFTGVIGYYCHNADDECTDEDDCVKDKVKGYCAFDPDKKHWRCGYGHCVG